MSPETHTHHSLPTNRIVAAACLAAQVVARCFSQCMLVVGVGLVCGCSTTTPEPEASVRPGVNESYLTPDLDVSGAIERFEREGREVYDQREAILECAALKPGITVADIGAGTGLFTLPFADEVGASGQVYAVDIAEPFVRHIEEQARARGLTNIKGVVCTERSVKLPPNSIDFAFLCDTYHHFEYPQNTLASLRRALKPGGEVLIVDFKRIPGVSSEWVLNHVRAGQETTETEMARAGFQKVAELPLLKENYILRFRSTRR